MAAALRKKQGEVYYTDIIYTLRDEFLNDDVQTPFFVSQGTGREVFVDDAHRLDDLRAKLSIDEADLEVVSSGQDLAISAPTLRERLEKAEIRFATPSQITDFTNRLFDGLRSSLSQTDFAEFFTMGVVEHADFKENTTRDFIVRTLDGEWRPDNFVRAKIIREIEPRNRLGLASMAFAQYLAEPPEAKVTYDLQLNCRMSRAQIKISFTPKYNSLHQIVLVVTCAPSLETSYVFEVVTEHRMLDFNEYDTAGNRVVQRWFRSSWSDSPEGIVIKIAAKLDELVRAHLEAVEQRLTK